MDTNSWISLLTYKILKKPCKGQIGEGGAGRRKKKTYRTAASLSIYTIFNYLTRSTKK